MPAGESPLTAADCYRFALSHPAVDVCMMGTRSADQMRENLRALDLGPLGADEMSRIRRIGDHIYGKPRARP
jgi:aryl-alcohol dehydrogenase-like predicted oxidoreductase